jgi:hypothetical protein
MFLPQQIRNGSLCDQLFIDGTGQMVRDWQNKKVLFHPVVGKQFGKDKITSVPMAFVLSTKGTKNEVKAMLRFYFAEVRKVKPSWKPRSVVSDFSFAYRH